MLYMSIAYIFVFFLGLCIGSFLNVCIYRIPEGKSIVFPPSACPACGKRLGFFELFPVLSFIMLKGRCKGCKAKISWRYPLIELLTGILFVLIFWKYQYSFETIKYLIFIMTLITIAFIDIDKQIIPNIIVIPIALIGLGLGYQDIWSAILGLLVGFSVIATVILASRGGMGWGDAKLLAMIGAFLGWQATLYSLFLGSLFGGILGIGLLLSKKIERKTPIPFGPFLSLGAMIWLFFPWWFH